MKNGHWFTQLSTLNNYASVLWRSAIPFIEIHKGNLKGAEHKARPYRELPAKTTFKCYLLAYLMSIYIRSRRVAEGEKLKILRAKSTLFDIVLLRLIRVRLSPIGLINSPGLKLSVH